MITIVISACMIAHPDVCRDYRLPLEQAVDSYNCALFAPPHFGTWADSHPGWRITRWRCTSEVLSDKDI